LIAFPSGRVYIGGVTDRADPGGSAGKDWNVLSMLTWADAYLAERGIEEARLNAELLLAHVLQIPRLQLYLQFDRPLVPEELAAFKALFRRRLAREPLQYILGETNFMGLTLRVDRRALIPRPETEHLVEAALAYLKSHADPSPAILDIGTGSGNIAIALGKSFPGSRVVSIDKSGEALGLARENADSNLTPNVVFVQGDVLQDVEIRGTFDLIVSNPPYVSLREYNELEPEVREFEPREAVTDGEDGLRFIRAITARCSSCLAPGGGLMIEIAYNQEKAARRMLEDAGCVDVSVLKDYAGHPRVVRGVRPGGAA
jgi:release factor glutamine methyltransferase